MDGKRTASRLAGVLAGLIVAIVLAGSVFLVLGRSTPQSATAFAFRGYGFPLAIVFAAAGVLVASRVPTNPIGWLLLVACAGTPTLGGTFEVRSAPGRGTTVSGRLPVTTADVGEPP